MGWSSNKQKVMEKNYDTINDTITHHVQAGNPDEQYMLSNAWLDAHKIHLITLNGSLLTYDPRHEN